MASSTSRLSYSDCYDLFDKALAADKGIRFPVLDKGSANHFRVRLNTARALNRRDNYASYTEDHPLWGRSEYDSLSVLVRDIDGQFYIYLTKIPQVDSLNVEELGDEFNGAPKSSPGDHGKTEGEIIDEIGEEQIAAAARDKVDRRF